jgi:hypothetical protein
MSPDMTIGHPQEIYALAEALTRRGSDTDIGLEPESNFRRLPGDVPG